MSEDWGSPGKDVGGRIRAKNPCYIVCYVAQCFLGVHTLKNIRKYSIIDILLRLRI